MAEFTKNALTAVAEAFDGTEDTADLLVAAYPDIISIQQEESEETGDAILAVINEKNEVLNAYKDTVIVFASGYGVPDTTTVWTKADFAAYWTANLDS